MKNSLAHSRRGFSLSDLLICSSIAVVFAATLLPALQESREAARQETCKSNLLKIGLASLEYEAVNGQYPPYMGSPFNFDSIGDVSNDALRYQLTYSLTQLLAFVGEQDLADMIDPFAFDDSIMTIADVGYPNITDWISGIDDKLPGVEAITFDNQIEFFRCPADQSSSNHESVIIGTHTTNTGGVTTFHLPRADPDSGKDFHALTNYISNAGAIGITDTPSAILIDQGWEGFHGPIRSRKSESFDSIEDGAANVVLFAESMGNINSNLPDLNNARHSSALGGIGVGRADIYSGVATIFGNAKFSNWIQFGSAHPDIVNTVFADGSIRGFPRNTHPRTFGRLCGVEDGISPYNLDR